MGLMSICRLTLMAVVSLCALAGGLVFASAPAPAAIVHNPLSSFGGSETPAGSLGEANGVGVDEATGDVYVADLANNVVDKFSAGGIYLSQITGAASPAGSFSFANPAAVAVDDSTNPLDTSVGDVYVLDSGHNVVDRFDSTGVYQGQLTGTTGGPFAGTPLYGVAVDSEGNVWVYQSNAEVDEFDSSGGFITKFNTEESGASPGFAVDSLDDVYFVKGYPATAKETSTGGELGLIDSCGCTVAIATDQSNDVYVDDGSYVAEYDSSENPIARFGSAQLTASGRGGIALNNATGSIYIANPADGKVYTFSTSIVPDVTTGAASNLLPTSATPNGTINPDGVQVTSCQFEYGTSLSYGQSVPCAQTPAEIGSGSNPVAVSADLSGLQQNTVYHFRLSAANANLNSTNTASDETFTTVQDIAAETGTASNLLPTGATLNGTINPDGVQVTSCQFEYGTSPSYGQSVPCAQTPAEIGSGSNPVAVSADISGLQPNAVYHFRLVADNADGASIALDETFTTPGPPIVDGESVSAVGASIATVRAQVNAVGSPTTYRFEYGTSSVYGASTPQVSLGSAQGDAGASTQLTDLQPNTVYHFRIVTSNENGTTFGADATFTTFPTATLGLPDGRGYELVSSVSSGDGEVYEPYAGSANTGSDLTTRPFQAAADGNAMAYIGESAVTSGTGEDGQDLGNQYLATRAPAGGWTAVNIEPPSGNISEKPVYQAFSSDLSVGFLSWDGRTALTAGTPGDGYHILYSRTSSDGSYHPFLTTTPPNRAPSEFGSYEIPYQDIGSLVFAGASSNLEHRLFVANDALTANALDRGETENNLYDSVNGQLRLVNVLPDGTSQPNAIFGSAGDSKGSPDFSHVISNDGTRIFWTDLNNGDLYVRENGVTTVQVDAGVGGGGRFWTASADGSKVFFTKAGDLYEYNVENGQTNDLTPAGEVQGMVGAAEDGSYVYFVANGALAPGATPQACEPNNPSTGCNLYVLHEGEAPKFIARLSGADDNVAPLNFSSPFGDWRPGLGSRTAAVTPDGRQLVFMSQQSLTGYENRGRQEVYVYDAQTAQLSCASCNPSGEPPTSSGNEYVAFLPPSSSDTYLPRWISEDGSRVFFDSIEALVPQDTNGRLDVYEWEQDEAGSCRHSGGCIYLLSSGNSTDNSYLTDASTNGNDVFIVTRSQLAPQDENENFDIYDVRVGAAAPPLTTACSGVDCQGASSAPPVFAAPSSETFNGAGNLVAPATVSVKPRKKATVCRKGFVKSHGKCVKQKARAKKKSKAKKSAKGRK
jgi:hypothetical protein